MVLLILNQKEQNTDNPAIVRVILSLASQECTNYLLSNSALLQFIEVPFQIERVALLLDGCRFCATKNKLHLLQNYTQKLSKSIL